MSAACQRVNEHHLARGNTATCIKSLEAFAVVIPIFGNDPRGAQRWKSTEVHPSVIH